MTVTFPAADVWPVQLHVLDAVGVEKIAGRALVPFKALERWFRAGVVLDVFVRRRNQVGRNTRFEIRGEQVPKRTDGCLRPGAIRRAACPRG